MHPLRNRWHKGKKIREKTKRKKRKEKKKNILMVRVIPGGKKEKKKPKHPQPGCLVQSPKDPAASAASRRGAEEDPAAAVAHRAWEASGLGLADTCRLCHFLSFPPTGLDWFGDLNPCETQMGTPNPTTNSGKVTFGWSLGTQSEKEKKRHPLHGLRKADPLMRTNSRGASETKKGGCCAGQWGLSVATVYFQFDHAKTLHGFSCSVSNSLFQCENTGRANSKLRNLASAKGLVLKGPETKLLRHDNC